jgi:glutamate synthase domain-containing protein 2
MNLIILLAGVFGVLLVLGIYDVLQKKHAILRNFPVIGHLRYLLEAIGPELRQYIVTSNDEERPFSRDERSWVYASSKSENNYFGFGSDNDLETPDGSLIIKQASFPLPSIMKGDPEYAEGFRVPCAKVMGAHRGRKKAFRPNSVVNISAMSFGSLSSKAIESLNRGGAIARCLHNTGEGGVSPYHKNGGELIWQIGTGYFGCRDEAANFSIDRFVANVQQHPIKAIEIKLSQGAKPGMGGLLPAAKITPEIAAIRGIPMNKDCASPSSHSAFHDVDSLLDFVELLAEKSGLPVGIKSAVGEQAFWYDLTKAMAESDRGVDFVTIDGGEGGTGAAPLVFSDHVALPFKAGFTRVYREFIKHDLQDKVVFIGSGRLGLPEHALVGFALGCDLINVGREAMLAIGCIQAMRCHTGHCPTGIATQNKWLMRGLDPTSKADRLANYVITLRKELLAVSRACGHSHPSLVKIEQLEILDQHYAATPLSRIFETCEFPEWGLPGEKDRQEIQTLMEKPKAAA